MQRNTGYFPTESLEPSGNRLFSRSALNEGDLFRGSLTQLPFNQTMFQSDNDFLTFAEQMLQDTDAMPNSNLTLLTLITCAYDWDGARTVVVAVATNEE